MFNKALKIAVSFGVLLALHLGYVRLFAIVAERAAREHGRSIALTPTDSRTKKEAIGLAARAFGKDHWSADRELPGRYYNKERGYWMYYKEYERLNDGKRFKFKPFALIWQSRDKKELKKVLSDEAIMDLDRPMGLAVNKSGSPMRLVHAQITGNVLLSDDKGTADTADDMLIGPMPYLEYDEATLQVKSDSEVVIQDREMWVNGHGLLIQLRPKDESDPTATAGGFDGAKTAYLKKNVHIILYDAGRSGILPGTARVDQTAEGRTPVDVRCVGEMQIDLPKPRLPIRVGPPAPPDPTFARFSRDVVVLRGKLNQTPDQLNCDHLKLTLLPGEKPDAPGNGPAGPAGATATATPKAVATVSATPSEAGTSAEPAPAGDSLGGLTLRRADATGHAVWLQSESQGIKTRCNEMIYKKLAPEKPDETYLRGDTTTLLWVEKLDIAQDGPKKGKITSVTTIRAIDATIFNNDQSRDPETIIARGPGILETRPAKDQPVERRAIWRDQLVTQNEKAADAQLRKRITLTGDPKFFDVAQATTLDAKREIIVWLKPKPAAATSTLASTASATGSSSSQPQATPTPVDGKYEIETLRALEDVHLTAPGRIMTARDWLFAVFKTVPAPAAAGPSTAASAGTTAIATHGPAVAAAGAPAPATPAQAEAKPAEPEVTVRANQVWARITLRPGAEQGNTTLASAGTGDQRQAGNMQSEVEEARLRGSVFFHQDPAPDKQRGTNVTGDAVDVTNLGDDKMYFKVFRVDPDKIIPRDQKNKIVLSQLLARIDALGSNFPLARVETDDFTVEGPIIGLNQLTDEAWVDGGGILTQMAPRSLLTDKGLDNAQAPAPAKPVQGQGQAQAQATTGTKAEMTPLKISWTRAMQFKGLSTNPKGVPVARAQFFDNVHAENEDSVMVCQEMTTYMDRVIRLNRPKRGKAAGNGNGNEAAEPEPKAQIALIDCLRKVTVDSRKYDPDSAPRTLVERQVIVGEHLTYDKLTGNFLVPGAGKVYLYDRGDQDDTGNPVPAPGPATTANRRTITPTANPTSRPAPNTRRATEVVGRNANADTVKAATTKAKAKVMAAVPPLQPLKLTQIVFNEEMHGRFGTGKDSDTTETRWADFFGDVQILRANVAMPSNYFDFDKPPLDGMFLTAQTVRVVSEPPLPGSKSAARNFLKAWENATAATVDRTIQADKITYDSLKELFYAYGEDGRPVFVVEQKTAGQPATVSSGDAAVYNRKTGESQFVKPQSIQLVDDKFGVRFGPQKAVDPPKKPKKPLAPIKPPNGSYFERKSFTGH